jgi:hypothetical protein
VKRRKEYETAKSKQIQQFSIKDIQFLQKQLDEVIVRLEMLEQRHIPLGV